MGLSNSEELGRAIANSLNTGQQIKQDVIPAEIINSMLIAPIDGLQVTLDVTGYRRVMSNILVVEHPVYGVVNKFPVFSPMVLGHPIWGILGQGYFPPGIMVFPLTFPDTFDGATYARTALFTYNS